jgi:FkbM family methyltransferase
MPTDFRALLRPAKVRNAIRRRVFERNVAAIPVARYEPLVHLGTDYGGWWVPDDLIGDDWTCYCVGAGSDVSFDLELIARYGARVRSFDPFDVHGEKALRDAQGNPRFSFHCLAVAMEDGPIDMIGRQDTEVGNVSAVGHADGGEVFTRQGRTIPSLMTELGDTQIQLLKIDVEGLEYELLPTLDLRSLGVRVFLVEVHHNRSDHDVRQLVLDRQLAGYRLIHRKKPGQLTFVSN